LPLRAVEVWPSARDRAIVLLPLYAGTRTVEIRALDVADVCLSARKGEVHLVGKGAKFRTVLVHPKLREALAAWLAESPTSPARLPPPPGWRTTHVTSHVLRHPSDLAQDGDDAAEDAGLIAWDRRMCRVVRDQPDVPVALLERPDCCLATDICRDYVAVPRERWLPYHDPVPVRDGGADHGVIFDLEHERRALADQLPGQRQDIFHALLVQDRHTGGDPPDQWHAGSFLPRDVNAGFLGWLVFFPVGLRSRRRVTGQAHLYGRRGWCR
jgi:hypothetical protein